MTSERVTIYNTTTTAHTQGNDRRNKFVLLSGTMLFVTGLVVTIVCSYTYLVSPAETEEKNQFYDQDDSRWVVLVTGLILLVSGLLLLGIYWSLSRRRFPNSTIPGRTGALPVPKPNKPRDAAVQETERTPSERNAEVGERAELVRNEFKNQERVKDMSEIPAHLSHYKPRNFNQHGYGTKNAPIATLDEFDHSYSLRSSMNSLWSQHMNQQVRDLSDEDEEDALSFQSVIMQ